MTNDRREEIELQAEADLRATGQRFPPYRPSLILEELEGIKIERGTGRRGAPIALLVPGQEPRCVISPNIGSRRARTLAGHEAGHARLEHVPLRIIWVPPPHYSGKALPKTLEQEAERYGIALTMPRTALQAGYAHGPQSLPRVAEEFDVEEFRLRKRLHELDLWRITYDDRNHRAYMASGWWKLTRRPSYLKELAERQNKPYPICERTGCIRLATVVNHLCYGNYGCETDDELEGLCPQCHYEEHVSVGPW